MLLPKLLIVIFLDDGNRPLKLDLAHALLEKRQLRRLDGGIRRCGHGFLPTRHGSLS